MQKLIPLKDWADKNGIDQNRAREFCRKGRLKKIVVIKTVPVNRYYIPENFVLPSRSKVSRNT